MGTAPLLLSNFSVKINSTVENTSIHHSEKKIVHFTLGKIALCE